MGAYDETEFVLYALAQLDIAVQQRSGNHITLTNGYEIEVERRDLYRLSVAEFVISPFDDIGELCQFIQRNSAYGDD